MMKKIFIIIILLFLGCKSEKQIVQNEVKTQIEEISNSATKKPNLQDNDTINTEVFIKEEVTIPKRSDEIIQQNGTELSLLFIGDFMGHMDQIQAAYNKETKTYNYDSCFLPIKEILSDVDVTIGNIEVTLGVKPYSGYPQFSSPSAYAQAIKNAGVDVLATANNHSCDKRKKGLEKTIAILDSLSIMHTGTFINAEEKKKSPALFIEKDNFKVALINYTYGTNEIPPTYPNIVNYLKKETIKADVEAVRKHNPDQIIAFVHWGIQYKDLPNQTQKDMFHYFKSLGVNIVIGAHPHVLQPMEWHKASPQQPIENLVVYSLGNFVSHQRTFPRDGGAVFKLVLKKDKEEKVSIKQAEYTLTWVQEPIINGKKHYFVLPADTYSKKPEYFTNPNDYNKMMRFITHARTLLGKYNINIGETLSN